MKPIRASLLCLGLLLSTLAHADSWEPVGLFGGWPNDMALDAEGGIVSTVNSGGVYRRAGASSLWERIQTMRDVRPRSVATGAPGTIYVGTDGDGGTGFMRTNDGGFTWTSIPNAISHSIVQDLEVSLDYSTIWACTYGDGLYRSTDGGASFTPVTSLPTSYPRFITTTPTGGLYVGAEFSAVDLYFSGDAGVTWESRYSGPGGGIHAIAVDPIDGDLYGVDNLGVLWSADDGVTWAPLGAPAGAYVDVAVRGDRIYAAGFTNVVSGGRVYYSDDDGAHWTQDTGLPGQSVTGFLNTPDWLYLGVTGPGPYRRSDTGTGWEPSAQGMTNLFITSIVPDPLHAQVHVLVEQLGIMSSSDGVNWAPTGPGIPPYEFLYAMTPSPDGNLYASGAYGGVYRSTNGGGSWSGVSPALATALATNDWGHVYAGSGNRIRRSVDQGATWTNLPLLTGVQGIADLACLGTEVYAATGYFQTGGRGVYRSTNGTDFAPFNDGLTNLEVTSLGIDPDPNAACRISAGTRNGLFDLSGLSWDLNLSLAVGEVKKVRKFSSDKMAFLDLLIRKLGGVCEWNDAKGPDQSFARDFGLFSPSLPAHGAGTPQTVRLLATYGNGLWRGAEATTDVEGPGGTRTGVTLQIGRNPFVHSTDLGFELSRPGAVRLEVFDAAGRRVASLVDGWRDAGPHRVRWHAASVAGGIYFGRLTAEGSTHTARLLRLP